MSDFASDIAAVRAATDRLLTGAAALDDAGAAAPSLLPGWTRGHVFAHIARNADAITNLLTWARTDVKTPMYVSAEARDADIERDSTRPSAAHLDDLRSSAARFDEAASALSAEQQEYVVEMRNGVMERAAMLPYRRLVEVELHHVDLGIGYGLEDLPAAFVTREIGFMADVKLAGRAEVPALRLTASDGSSWRTGREDGDAVTVTGSPTDLLGWLVGRGDGAGLEVRGGSSGGLLPALPPL
ncbi:maleylpyruvate isomerase family mycothiol-dependent enzyme [Streptomyces sp. NPDC057654]|uniref:maleylpyruvate isomerase family mycothiol-dependent enzyme n=1 Tax=Streptomyces sp. NPDC057654 TaxID=3346196 RepID=UPI003698A2D7